MTGLERDDNAQDGVEQLMSHIVPQRLCWSMRHHRQRLTKQRWVRRASDAFMIMSELSSTANRFAR